ncbi:MULTISPECIES: DUF5326 family protein [unclassified Streptomyces]|uniref:DUF5326 family protein n=1 Tax=unclassified Streptomyces TaxID=2593676 RepID=UPI0022B6F5EE|nr:MULTISPECIES: DUF5326 family protein [unclassified Streptomyces]MCZ7417630.1 DUF5326 family protein [Streptomyces sp. WMMC897]MCZ7432560.1 DUF5326 family protein [Streptomyces sp. WMMC1477]
MSAKSTLAGLPTWIKWVGILVVAMIVFKAVVWLVTAVVGLLFNLLLFAAVVAVVVFLARKFLSSSSGSSSGGW